MFGGETPMSAGIWAEVAMAGSPSFADLNAVIVQTRIPLPLHHSTLSTAASLEFFYRRTFA
jgi:hypothetical protein